ncbi:DUF1360 domain-containing protein [Streptomyces aureoversilis]|uniref:DUF1360 domain-containing protein n=1 Tax=Streptomyces aureoversilis TaxID=67277 RepID=A0ABV9ZTA7_9ACTN
MGDTVRDTVRGRKKKNKLRRVRVATRGESKRTRDRLRQRVHRPDNTIRRPYAFLTRLVACTWCTSMWVAAAIVAASYLLGDTLWFKIPAAVLTLSWLTGVVSSWLDSPPLAAARRLPVQVPRSCAHWFLQEHRTPCCARTCCVG